MPARVLPLGLIIACLPGCAVSPPPSPRSVAIQELRGISRWTEKSLYQQQELDNSVRLQILEHAARAAELDPDNEEAAFLVAVHSEARYAAQVEKKSPACADEVLARCRRYLDRFGQGNPEHGREILYKVMTTGLMAWTSNHDWTRNDDLLRPPDVKAYPYVRVATRAAAQLGYLAETDDRYDIGNYWQAFSYWLIRYVIPNCPEDLLEEEHVFWKKFWDKEVRDVPHPKQTHAEGRPLPWGIIEATFAARRKDVEGVRLAFQQVAREHSRANTHVWGGSEYQEYLVPMYLRAAGDTQWQTWEPDFTTSSPVNNTGGNRSDADRPPMK